MPALSTDLCALHTHTEAAEVMSWGTIFGAKFPELSSRVLRGPKLEKKGGWLGEATEEIPKAGSSEKPFRDRKKTGI